MMQVTRRKVVKTLLALGAGGVLPSYFSAFTSDGGKVRASLLDLGPSPDAFRDLSAFVTLRDDLPPRALADMYKVFMDEPWGPEHMTGLLGKIKKGLKNRPSLKDKSWDFSEGESWFAGHLLTTWYLGVYYHQERPTQRILYEDALMFKPLAGLIPVPFIEPIGYGAWAEKPAGAP